MEQNQTPAKRLYRSTANRIIFGVCGGLGEYFDIDPIIFRIIFIALIFGAGTGVLLYIIMAFVIPKASSNPNKISETGSDKIEFDKRLEGLVSELKESGNSTSKKSWIGGIIVILGVMLLMDQVFPKHFFSWNLFWPIVIIFMGVLILSRDKKACCPDKTPSMESAPEQPQSSQAPPKEAIKEFYRRPDNNKGGMGSFFFGLLFLVVGFVYLAQNLGLVSGININFEHLLKFWPVFIILIGLSMLSKGTWLGKLLSALIMLGIIALIAVSFFFPKKSFDIKKYSFDIDQNSLAGSAVVNVKTGFASVIINGGAEVLASGKLESNIAHLITDTTTNNGVQQININTKGEDVGPFLDTHTNDLQINLSDNIPMSLTIDSGASILDLDLSTIQMNNLRVNSGASKLNLVLGNRVALANAEINAGASMIDIILPKDLGVRLNVKSDLSSKDFPEFRPIDKNTYESNNYATAQNKIEISIDAGVSEISVSWR